MNYHFKVQNDKITPRNDIILYTGNVKAYSFSFEFDESWNGLKKFISFSKNSELYIIELIDNSVTLPSEIFEATGTCTFGLYATNLDDDIRRISTNILQFKVAEGTYSDENSPKVPTPDVWESLFKNSIPKIIDDYWYIYDILKGSYENTNIRAVGEKGDTGYAPQKGIDYYTDAEKEEFKSSLLGDIDAALDNIIAIQNTLIGGDSI